MTHTCCPSCRLRFAPPAEELAPCPVCGTATIALDAEDALGFQRHVPVASEALATAVALRMPADVPEATP